MSTAALAISKVLFTIVVKISVSWKKIRRTRPTTNETRKNAIQMRFRTTASTPAEQLGEHGHVVAHDRVLVRHLELVRHHGEAVLAAPGAEGAGRGVAHVRHQGEARLPGDPRGQGPLLRARRCRRAGRAAPPRPRAASSSMRRTRARVSGSEPGPEPGDRTTSRGSSSVERCITGIGTPVPGREVPVQVHAPGVAPGAPHQAVGVGREHDRAVARRLRERRAAPGRARRWSRPPPRGCPRGSRSLQRSTGRHTSSGRPSTDSP